MQLPVNQKYRCSTLKKIVGPEIGLMQGSTKLFDSSDWLHIERYFHLSSSGWYFKGDNVLEISGGCDFTKADFTFIKIHRQPSETDEGVEVFEEDNPNVEKFPKPVKITQAVSSSSPVNPKELGQLEASMDSIFEKMESNAHPHLRVKKIHSPLIE